MRAEPEGFREFVEARSPGLLRTAWMLTGNAASAEDLLQTALARTWPHWERVAQGNPDAYVRTVMVRTNSSWRGRFWNRERPTGSPEVIGSASDDSTGSVDERIVLAAALARLPLRQRQVVILRFFDDLSVEETARIMAISPGTVKSQCARAVGTLRDAMVLTAAHEAREQR